MVELERREKEVKVPLRYQMTEYDCGTESVMNALSYVFEREDILADLLRIVFRQTLDEMGEDGHVGDGGTSRGAMGQLTGFINDYAIENKFPIHAEHITGEAVTEELLRNRTGENSAIVAGVWLTTFEHYVLITKIEHDKVYIFDPYYVDKKRYDNDEMVEIVPDAPKTHNRIVKIDRLMGTEKDLCMGEVDRREVLVILRGWSQKEDEK